MDKDALEDLLIRQDGVIARRQARDVGLAPHDIRCRLRMRHWVRVHRGVYVNHTGPLTWRQRAWAAVLLSWPAALSHATALRADNGPGERQHDDDGPLHIAVERTRGVQPIKEGIVTHYLADLETKVNWAASPPRVWVEHAVLDVAAEARSDHAAIAKLTNAVQARRTTATRIRDALDTRSRIARRDMLAAVLDDIRDGTCSLLEHGYLNRVERPHGLPVAERQLSASSRGPVYRDVTYTTARLIVELDGRLFHDNPEARDRDLDRDLDAAIDRLATVRVGWGQVFDRPCETARKIGRLLRQRGWVGEIAACEDCSDPR